SPDALMAKHRFRQSYWQFRIFKAEYLPDIRLDGTLPNINRSIDAVEQNDGTTEYIEKRFDNYSVDLSINQKVGFTGGEFFIRSGLRRNDNIFDSTSNIQYLSTPVNIGYIQPLFKYNSYKWDKKIKPMEYTEAERTYLENVEQISITATNYFFNLLLAQIEKKIALKNQSNYDTLFNIAKGRFNLGKIAENELLQLELNLLRAQSSVETADLDYENSLFRLKSYLRVKDEENIELIPPKETYHFDIPIDKAVFEAKNNTTEAIAFERRLLEAQSSVNKSKMDGRFDADIYAVFGLTQTSNDFQNVYNNPLDQQQVSLGIHVPILDWGLARGNIKLAQSRQELVRTSIEQERIDFEQNIFLEVMQFKMQKNQLFIAAKADTVAQKRYDITQKRYMIGKINDVLELNMAQIDNDNSRKAYFSSLKTYWRNYYNLRKLTLYDFKNDKRIVFNITEIQ
ncbi:MAG: TolC family protein, partial [Bacteroidales bacterium]|nr:TolC family protein [Bacteroidales bacterium]